MKKCFAILFSLMVIFSFCLPSYAYDANNGILSSDDNQARINEYDVLKSLSKMTGDSLRERGYSDEEIVLIHEYETVYAEHINSLATKSDAVLLQHGYDAAQIKVIKNFSGSEAEMRAVAATLNISASPVNFTGSDGSYTRGRLAYSWNWYGIPAIRLQDMVAVSWNGWVVEENVGYVYYYNINTGQHQLTSAPAYSNDNNSLYGAGHKFYHRPGSSIESDYLYAKMGSGYFNVRSDVHAVKDFFYYVEYGHTSVTVSAGISFNVDFNNAGFGGSISFNLGRVCSGSDEGEYVFEE